MNAMITVILAVQMLSALAMIGLILVQQGKGAEYVPRRFKLDQSDPGGHQPGQCTDDSENSTRHEDFQSDEQKACEQERNV